MDVKTKYLSLILLIFTLLSFSCKKYSSTEDCTTYDYADCNTIQPLDGILYMKFTINATYKKVPFVVYKGFVDSGDENIIYRDTAYTADYNVLVDFGKYYSVKAEYSLNGNKVFAVDGDEIKKWKVEKCDSTCWETQERTFHLTLK
jgi:hypothetical protein